MFEEEIKEKISEITQLGEIELEVPTDPKLGDYAFPCFSLAKAMKKSPAEVAKSLCESIKPSGNIERIEAKGPYLNFFIDKINFTKAIIQEILKKKSKYGSAKTEEKRPVVIEYSAPNTNKPMHLGHIRNNLLGMAVARILEFQGYRVIKLNWINDRGIHISKSMFAYMKWGKGAKPNIKPDHFVGDFYVLFNEQVRQNPELEQEAHALLRRWEEGDKAVVKIWKTMNEWAYEGFNETYKELGCEFDKLFFESEIYQNAKPILEKGLDLKIFTYDEEGAIVAKLEPELPNKVLLRADGTSIYATSDIALAIEKAKLNFSRSIYVIGSEQNLYMRQIFKILKLLSYNWADRLYHLSYGMVFLPEGRMKSREGQVVDADDIISEMKDMARKELKERYETLDEKELKKRSKTIGLGALKFFMLKTDADRDIYYDPEESIVFEGETGPYVQYAHARISSILRKSNEKIKKADLAYLKHEKELAVVKLLAAFPKVCKESATHYKPHLISRYLLDLAQSFNEFYHECLILREKQGIRRARLVLITAVKQVLKTGLGLLGIEAPERM